MHEILSQRDDAIFMSYLYLKLRKVSKMTGHNEIFSWDYISWFQSTNQRNPYLVPFNWCGMLGSLATKLSLIDLEFSTQCVASEVLSLHLCNVCASFFLSFCKAPDTGKTLSFGFLKRCPELTCEMGFLSTWRPIHTTLLVQLLLSAGYTPCAAPHVVTYPLMQLSQELCPFCR